MIAQFVESLLLQLGGKLQLQFTFNSTNLERLWLVSPPLLACPQSLRKRNLKPEDAQPILRRMRLVFMLGNTGGGDVYPEMRVFERATAKGNRFSGA